MVRYMHGDGSKIVLKKELFKNPIGCHLCPREMMRWVTTWWRSGIPRRVCVVFKTDWSELRPLFQPYMRDHSTLIWERALLITYADTSLEPALLVMGESLLRSPGTGSCQVGRPWLFLQGTRHTVSTPCLWYMMNMGARLHNFKMWNVGHGGYYQSSGHYVSII